MTPLAIGSGFVMGSLAGMGAFGAVAYVLLQAGLPVPSWLVPCAMGLAYGFAALSCPSAGSRRIADRGAPAPLWLSVTCMVLIGAVAAALVYGSLATPPRHWDGAVSWGLRADHLAASPTLEHAFFRDPAVYSHSRDYPLLQPLLIASGDRLLGGGMGRLLFPFLYLLLLAIVGTTLRRHGAGGVLAWSGASAVAVTPLLVSPTSGAVDSGYADLFLAVCVAGMASGLLLADPAMLLLSPLLAVLVKPEGVVYGALLVAVLWYREERRLLRWALGGWIVGAGLWLPLQHDLQHFGSGSVHLQHFAALALLATFLLGIHRVLQKLGVGPRARQWVAVAASPLLLLALPLLIVAIGNRGGSMETYLREFNELLSRLPDQVSVAAGFVRYGLLHMGYALTFWLPLLIVVAFLVHRRALPEPRLWMFTLLGLLSLAAPFVLSPESDLEHHLQSSMSRLQLHWLGAVWTVTVVWIARLGEFRERVAGAG